MKTQLTMIAMLSTCYWPRAARPRQYPACRLNRQAFCLRRHRVCYRLSLPVPCREAA
jgi:hypothetical protein